MDTPFQPEDARQDTAGWYRAWFRRHGIETDGIDIERLRVLMCVPLDEISTPVKGAFEALRWCAARGLRVVLVTNTLSRGDEEALDDWRRFGLSEAIHGVVSSHSAGWRKPHAAIFERVLEVAGARPAETFHVGDNLIADVWGAQRAGLRAIWRRRDPGTVPTDERGAPPERERGACEHPSDKLSLAGEHVRCAACGQSIPISVRPDAAIDDLTELTRTVERWLT